MARNFVSGTSVDVGSSSIVNAETIHGLMKTAILANAAWSLVEEFTSGTADHKVFKCATASSGLSADFYMTVTRISSNLTIGVGEQYNTTTKVLSDCVMGDTASRALTPATGLPTTASTITLATSSVTLANGSKTRFLNCLVSSYYEFAIDSDHCVFVVSSSSCYVGAFTSLVSSDILDPMPICLSDLSSVGTATSQVSGVSRYIGGASSPAPGFGWFTDGGLSSDSRIGVAGSYTSGANNGLQFTYTDKLQGGKAHVYEVAVLHYSVNAASFGYLRGKLKKILRATTLPSGMAVGDTSVINGTTWQVCSINGTAACNFVDTGVL